MNKEIKDIWCKALLSGDFKQGTGGLKIGDKYCCLGVLCYLHGQMTGNSFEECKLGGIHSYMGSKMYLPKQVAGFAELSHHDESRLSWDNDSGLTFAEIATYIREYL